MKKLAVFTLALLPVQLQATGANCQAPQVQVQEIGDKLYKFQADISCLPTRFNVDWAEVESSFAAYIRSQATQVTSEQAYTNGHDIATYETIQNSGTLTYSTVHKLRFSSRGVWAGYSASGLSGSGNLRYLKALSSAQSWQPSAAGTLFKLQITNTLQRPSIMGEAAFIRRVTGSLESEIAEAASRQIDATL